MVQPLSILTFFVHDAKEEYLCSSDICYHIFKALTMPSRDLQLN